MKISWWAGNQRNSFGSHYGDNHPHSSVIIRSGKRDTGGVPAVIGTSDENVFVVWGNNDTVNNNSEVMFRASIDGGQTYADKVNLSNSSDSNSTDFDVEVYH